MLDKVTPGNWITIALGAVALIGSWTVAEYRLGEAERRIEAVEARAEVLVKAIADVQIEAAKDHATLHTIVDGLDKEIEGIWPQLEELQKEYYRHEGTD